MAKEKNNAKLPDVQLLLQMGIDPKTGLPMKFETTEGFKCKNKTLLKILDEQNAINRYTWYNLPPELDAHLIERILYYKGQGMFFYIPENDKYYFLPYALSGAKGSAIDEYGRFTSVTPLPFNGSVTKEDFVNPFSGRYFEPLYEHFMEEITMDVQNRYCVLLKDYSEQISQTILPKNITMDPLVDVMADLIPFMRTALLNGTGIEGMRVQEEDEQRNVTAASNSINDAALRGEKYIPVVGKLDFQTLTSGPIAKAEEYLLSMQSLDNYRLYLHGLDNGGIFQKRSHMLESEQIMNGGKASFPLQDGLYNRQRFCDLVNSYTKLGMWCEISEMALGIDRDFDGESTDSGNDLYNENYLEGEE